MSIENEDIEIEYKIFLSKNLQVTNADITFVSSYQSQVSTEKLPTAIRTDTSSKKNLPGNTTGSLGKQNNPFTIQP